MVPHPGTITPESHTMFADSTTVSVNAVSKTLARVAFGDRKGTFESAADGLTLDIQHQVTGAKRKRKSVRLSHTGIAADPLLTGINRPISASFTFAMDVPPTGYTLVELENYVEALAKWLDVQANRDKLINGES